jgi:hypothetical protein
MMEDVEEHSCDYCERAFESHKALVRHVTMKHKMYIGATLNSSVGHKRTRKVMSSDSDNEFSWHNNLFKIDRSCHNDMRYSQISAHEFFDGPHE